MLVGRDLFSLVGLSQPVTTRWNCPRRWTLLFSDVYKVANPVAAFLKKRQ
jgi:hypothetical protein